MKIIKLSSKNVKRLRAVDITPDGNTVVIGGRNGQGKSSVLDSIAFALGGKDVICSEPVRRGEAKAEVICDLGEIVVRRTFTPDGGGSLTVESKDGAQFKQPQTKLNDFIGRLSFDPLEFSRMEPAKQFETLRALVGLDFSAGQARRDSLYAQRTDINRDAKALRSRLDATATHEGTPEAETPSSEIVSEMERAQKQNAANADARGRAINAERAWKEADAALDAVTKAADLARQRAAAARREADAVTAAASGLTDTDMAPFRDRLTSLEVVNAKVRSNALAATLRRDAESKEAASKKLTDEMDAIEGARQAAIATAKFPVAGLGFSAEGTVTFNDLPFDQASSAEKLRVSVAIGLALNPKLRVLLVRDASLLDDESMKIISAMADQNDAQLWLERVEAGGATVIIEDGGVQEAKP